MTKELQDKAWSVLPKEFKEEVKKEYRKGYVCETLAMLVTLFGYQNLTSDTEGEEMLCVKAKTIHEMYAANQRIMKDFRGSIDGINADLINHILRQLFGSKCLPDELHEDNFAKSMAASSARNAWRNAAATTPTERLNNHQTKEK